MALRKPDSSRPCRAARCRGVALIALLALIAMAILHGLVIRLNTEDFQQIDGEANGRQLLRAKEILLAYASTYPDTHPDQAFAYLPCPDMNGDGTADASDGSCGGDDGRAVVGLLPYKTLEMGSNQDASGNCLWYAVAGGFKASAHKPVPLNWDSQGNIEIRNIEDHSLEFPDNPNGGVAAVVISVGPTMPGQKRNASTTAPCGVSTGYPAPTVHADYIDTDASQVDRRRSAPIPEDATPLRLVQGEAGGKINNDRLIWITPKELWDRIRKRSDVAVSLDQRISALLLDLQGRLTNKLSAYPAAANRAMPSNLSYTPDSMLANDYENFKDHMRYLRCAPANTYCYSLNGGLCDGLLLFAGSGSSKDNGTASPRPSTHKSDTHYFETGSGGALSLLNGTAWDITSSTQSFSSLTPATDLAFCLTPKPITNSEMMNAANPVVTGYSALLNTNGSTLRLGTLSPSSAVSSANYYGCFWYPNPISLGAGLRVYFEFVASARNEGFTLVLADGERNPSTNMCGRHGDALGYAGNNGAVPPIRYPKIALEFDFATSNPGASGFTRNDPGTAPALHFAIDYWGSRNNDEDGNDDVSHGVGDGGSDPRNPDTAPGLAHPASNIANSTRVYIRLDLSKNYNASSRAGSYQTVAYIAKSFSGLNCLSSDFSNLGQDLATLCPSINTASNNLNYLSDTATLADIPGLGEAMKKVFMGFTTSMQGGGSQQVNITNFQAVRR